jgi:hypothetical protein
MGDEFYCILKLVSGEEILSLIMIDDNDGDTLIVLQNPVTMRSFRNHQGTFIKVKPWIELSNDDFFIIRLDKIITMTETTDKKIIKVYDDYISNLNDESIDMYTPAGKVKLSESMGYISSVEEARKKLEDIFKDIKES